MTREDRVWLCKLAMSVVNTLVYAQASSSIYVMNWRNNGRVQYQSELDKLSQE